MKKDVTNGGKNTDDYNVWKRMSLMEIRILMIIMYEKDVTNAGKNTDDHNVLKKDVTNAGKNTDDYNVLEKDVTNAGKNIDDYGVWKSMSLMQVRKLMIIMYEKECH